MDGAALSSVISLSFVSPSGVASEAKISAAARRVGSSSADRTAPPVSAKGRRSRGLPDSAAVDPNSSQVGETAHPASD